MPEVEHVRTDREHFIEWVYEYTFAGRAPLFTADALTCNRDA
jgi:hypothetical protein